MKKYFVIIISSILALAGCVKNQDNQKTDIQENGLSIFARTESPAESKTVVESGIHVYWEPGDEIAVFMGEKAGKFTTDITEPSATATFTGTLGVESWPEELSLWAVYPYSEDAVFDGETITATLPSVQIAREGSFGKDMNLSIAHSTSTTLQFYNVGGGIRFSVAGEGIKMVVLTGMKGETLSGQIRISFNNGIPTYTEGEVSVQNVALTAEGDGFVPGVWYYMNALPVSLSEGFQLRFIKDGSSGVRTFGNSVEVKRGIFGTVSNADSGVVYYEDAVVEEDVINAEDLITSCINQESDVETQREALESMPYVESVEVDDTQTVIRYVSGETVIYPYNFPSIFEEETGTKAMHRSKSQSVERVQTKAAYSKADVAIFNLFSEDPERTNQNRLIENTKEVFERAGKTVRMYSRDEFTVKNLVSAIDDNSIIYISSLGTKPASVGTYQSTHGNRILTGELYDEDSDTAKEYAGFLPKATGSPYENQKRFTVDIFQLLDKYNYSGDLVYLANCYTKADKQSNKNVIGWSGINRAGQAYGLIIADYMATWGKSFEDFFADFSKGGKITDPIENESTLIHYGQGWKSSGNKSGWVALKNGKKVVIDKPVPGEQKGFRLWSSTTSYDVKLSYRNDGTITTDGKTSQYENGNQYLFEYTDLGAKDNHSSWLSSDPLRFKNNAVSYTVKKLTPGVWRFRSYCRDINGRTDDEGQMDCTYAIFSKKFAANDVQESTPDVVTMGTKAGINDLVLGGAVINRSLAGLETGFEYWIKGSHANKWTIETAATYEDYFGAVLNIPDLDGEYEFRAYATDEEGNTGYGDVMSFKYGGSQQGSGAVDLGLPSGLKWASCNLGASAPEEYGDYFAWGETEPNKNNYSWGTYNWCNGSESSLTKYNYSDGKKSLDQADDAAHELLGDKWRMPTKSEWQELINNCNWTTTTSNGVNGVLATSKITGATLFFPFSGQKDGNEMKKKGVSGYYWTSTLSPFASLACLGALSPDAGDISLDRYLGISIRPVYGEANTNTEYGSHEAVDLGLTSGLKWASCNLGASAPEEYGDYFAWGATAPQESNYYDWDTCPFRTSGDSHGTVKFSKYNTSSDYGPIDNNTVLDPEDDAAAVNWGGTWRMPTDAEWTELRTECTWTWTTQNEVNGYLVTSNTNGNSIFLPAAGYRSSTDLDLAGSHGYYWSSSLYYYPYDARLVCFDSGLRDWYSSNRYFGFSVRPVSE